jgi:hypothetical protein
MITFAATGPRVEGLSVDAASTDVTAQSNRLTPPN